MGACDAGDYGSDSEEEKAQPLEVKQKALPLPDILVKSEVKVEHEPKPESGPVVEEEEVDYGSGSDDG